MNSGALVKVDTETWMERALGARATRLLLVGAGTIAVTLSVPTALIEDLATATGLSEMVRYFAPPIGLGTRLALGSALALVPAAVVWALWGSPAVPVEPQPDYDAEFLEIEDEDEMMHARKQSSALGWNSLIRLVRGGFHDNPDAQGELLARRRRDRHPDAPPRPPLFASRDLPPHENASAEAAPEPVLAVPPPYVPTFAQAVAQAKPASAPVLAVVPTPEPEIVLPRAPAPFSDEELAQAVAAIAPRQAVPVLARVEADEPTGLLETLDLPLIHGADLGVLAARFERGVAKREAIVHAHQAQATLHNSIGLAQSDASVRNALRAHRPVELVSPVEAVPAEDTLLRVDEDVEQALNSALATLRKLTQQARR